MEEIAWLVFQGISRVQGAVSDQLVALAAEAARYLELPVPMCGKIQKLEKRCAQISNETKFMVACLTCLLYTSKSRKNWMSILQEKEKSSRGGIL